MSPGCRLAFQAASPGSTAEMPQATSVKFKRWGVTLISGMAFPPTEKVNRPAAGAAAIQSIPTLMAFRDGILVFRQSGALPAKALEEVIDAIEALDMDDVRRQLDEAQAAEAQLDEAQRA